MSRLFSNFAVKKEIIYMNKTIYIYKGKEISHSEFLNICRKAGLTSGYRCSHYDHLVDMAFKGHSKAVEILNDLQVINPNYKEIF